MSTRKSPPDFVPLSRAFNVPDRSVDVCDEALAPICAAELRELLDCLPCRERYVLEQRFGLGGREPMTLREVGAALGVTQERIRQIQNETLKRLAAIVEAA